MQSGEIAYQIFGFVIGFYFKMCFCLGGGDTKNGGQVNNMKKKFLNKAGRLVLIKSCLSSLHVYFLSPIHMLASVELRLTQLMRNFLWDSNENKQKM